MNSSKTIVFKVDDIHCFFYVMPYEVEDICNCYAPPFKVSLNKRKSITLMSGGWTPLSSIIERFKEKLIQAMQGKLLLKSEISLAQVRALAHRASEQMMNGAPYEHDEWTYDYELIQTRGKASSWICVRDDTIYIEIFGPGEPQQTDVPLATLPLSQEIAREWIRDAFVWLERMNDVDGFTNEMLLEEKEGLKQLLGG